MLQEDAKLLRVYLERERERERERGRERELDCVQMTSLACGGVNRVLKGCQLFWNAGMAVRVPGHLQAAS